MRFSVSFIVYPEKSKPLSLTKLESLFSPIMSLTEMFIVLGSFEDSPVFFNSPLSTSNSLIFTESEEFDKELVLKMKSLLISNEFKKSKSEFPIPPPQKCLSERLGRAASMLL